MSLNDIYLSKSGQSANANIVKKRHDDAREFMSSFTQGNIDAKLRLSCKQQKSVDEALSILADDLWRVSPSCVKEEDFKFAYGVTTQARLLRELFMQVRNPHDGEMYMFSNSYHSTFASDTHMTAYVKPKSGLVRIERRSKTRGRAIEQWNESIRTAQKYQAGSQEYAVLCASKDMIDGYDQRNPRYSILFRDGNLYSQHISVVNSQIVGTSDFDDWLASCLVKANRSEQHICCWTDRWDYSDYLKSDYI